MKTVQYEQKDSPLQQKRSASIMSLLLIPIFALIGPQSIDELREVLPALQVQLTVEEMRWLNLEE